jgi:ABC-type Mn2+/Zn2+ transport system permease subunit
LLDILWVPFLACLVLTGIHVYLGLHVLARGVIFVDLALAQVAALGVTVGFLAGHPIQSPAAYWYALAFAVAGAGLLAASRTRRAAIPQEAIIGIVYVVSAAAAILVVDRAPQGSEHIKQLLVGSILTVTPGEIGALAALYAAVGALHWLVRRPLLEISLDPEGARARGRRVAAWDVAFYVSFALVVTSSVRLAGVLLVFAYLIIPAAMGALLATSVAGRLAIGWGVGVLVSAAGLIAAYRWDLPTGASVVTAFGVLIGGAALARRPWRGACAPAAWPRCGDWARAPPSRSRSAGSSSSPSPPWIIPGSISSRRGSPACVAPFSPSASVRPTRTAARRSPAPTPSWRACGRYRRTSSGAGAISRPRRRSGSANFSPDAVRSQRAIAWCWPRTERGRARVSGSGWERRSS